MDSVETSYTSITNPIITNRQELQDEIISEIFSLQTELEILRSFYRNFNSIYRENEEEEISVLRIQEQNNDLIESIKQISIERDNYRDEIYKLKNGFQAREDEFRKEKEEIRTEVENCNDKIKELLNEKSKIVHRFSENLDVIKLIKKGLLRATEIMEEEDEVGNSNEVYKEKSDDQDLDWELGNFLLELKGVYRFVSKLELQLEAYKEKRKKEMKELENSLASLTDENRDTNCLLRIALVEKEAMERSLNKLKGNFENKRSTIFQIAERGLQRVGFGFMMMGAAANEQTPENSNSANVKSDSSECEEEEMDNLASTMDRIMKKLRLEISQLKRSLDESRSETERLQRLSELQSSKLSDNMTYIEELENRELILTQEVEKLHIQIKEREKEVARWREACELEVEAGNNAIKEYENLVNILKQELMKVKTDLDLTNEKLKRKEELITTAIAAQEAAERSLNLADSRVAGLHERMEALTKELEAADEQERRPKKIRVRHICWPWQALKFSSTANNTSNVKQLIPEMQPLSSLM